MILHVRLAREDEHLEGLGLGGCDADTLNKQLLHLPKDVKIVSLSATVSNAEEFGAWLDEVRGDTEIIVSEIRPVPLNQHVLFGDEMIELFDDAGHTTAWNMERPRYETLQPLYNLYDRAAFEGPLQQACIRANVGVITGGTARNVVPEWCTFTAEARSHDERKLGGSKRLVIPGRQRHGGKQPQGDRKTLQ